MSNTESPQNNAEEIDPEYDRGIKSVLTGVLFIVISIAYYFLASHWDAHPPERERAIYAMIHGIFGTVGGAVVFAAIGLVSMGFGVVIIRRYKASKTQ